MSKWCPKCQRINENGDKCDFCGQAMEDTFNKDILLNQILQEISDEYKANTTNNYQGGKTRSAIYKEYIADHYRGLGYSVTEHGEEKGIEYNGIDLIAKKDDEVIFIQCKDWEKNNLHDKDIKILRIDTYDFLEKNPIFKTYKIKMKYTLSRNFIDTSATKYIDECKDDISYEIIEPDYRKAEQIKANYTKESSSKISSKQNRDLEKIIITVIAILAILFFLKPTSETKQIEPSNTNKTMITVTQTDQAAKKNTQAKLKAQKEQKEKERIKKLLSEQKTEREKHEKEQKARIEKDKAEQIKILIKKKSIEDQKINIKHKEVPKVVNQEEARTKAKRKLLEEMQLNQKKVSNVGEQDNARAEAKRKLLEQMQFSN